MEKTIHSLHCHWRQHYTLYTATVDCNTLFTLSLETRLHSLHCHWRLHYTLHTVTGDYNTLSTLLLETAIHSLHCHWRLHYTLYTITDCNTPFTVIRDYCTLFTLPLETTLLEFKHRKAFVSADLKSAFSMQICDLTKDSEGLRDVTEDPI